MCLILLAVIAFWLFRSGRFGPPPWVRHRAGAPDGRWGPGPHGPHDGGAPVAPSPEAEARRILAERLATGEIDTDEYLERVSVLNHDRG